MDLVDIVSKAAPILGGLLVGGPVGAGAAALKLIASEFGVEPTANKVAAALQAAPDAAVKLRKMELDNKALLQRLSLENETARLSQINATIRTEAVAEDPYVRRWRPTIGYVVAGQLALLGISIFITTCAAIGAGFYGRPDVVDPLFAGLSTLISSLTAIMGIELTVLGVGIAKRSQDKAVAAGNPPASGLINTLLSKVSG